MEDYDRSPKKVQIRATAEGSGKVHSGSHIQVYDCEVEVSS